MYPFLVIVFLTQLCELMFISVNKED